MKKSIFTHKPYILRIKNSLDKGWASLLNDELNKPYIENLEEFVAEEYENFDCYPTQEAIFNAFSFCSINTVKVVLIGQDPYHGEGQANGLCFSVGEGVKHPPSLVNIFKEIETDVGVSYPESGSLERWASQGVLLLNATLTVRAHEAGSHQKKGWETFTDSVISHISQAKTGVVFMLWGGYAKKKNKLIDAKKHHVLLSGHPSPLSANRGYWFGNKHFSTTNSLLKSKGNAAIIW